MTRKYNHYFKPCPFTEVDVYRVLKLFEVSDPCLQHAIKKLLCAGGRGAKNPATDVKEAIDALARWQEMRSEEEAVKPWPNASPPPSAPVMPDNFGEVPSNFGIVQPTRPWPR